MTAISTLSHAKRTFLLTLMLVGGISLAACSEYKTVNENVARAEAQTDAMLKASEPSKRPADSLMVDRRPWFGSTAMPLTNGTALPTKFQQENSIVVTFPGAVTMQEFAQLIEGVTGLRVVVNTATQSASQATTTAQGFMPGDGEIVTGGRVVWQGRLSDLLNQAADYYGGEWSYDGAAIALSTQVSKTFMLHALASTFDSDGEVKTESDSSSSGSSGGSSGSSLPSANVKNSVSIKIWDEIKEAVNTIVSGAGTAAFSPSTGTVTVTGSPAAVRKVENYLNQQNAMRLRRIAVAVNVLNVTLDNSLNISTSASDLIKTVMEKNGIRVTGTGSDGLSFTLQDNSASVTAVANKIGASEGISRVSIEHSGSIVTLSDQPAPLQIGRQISYLASLSTSTTDTTTSVSLTPATLNVGLLMTVLPRIVETNRILMRLSMSISNTTTPFPTFGPGDNQVQLPEVSSTGFLQNAVLTSGETLVLAGFERNENSATNDGVPGGGLLGTTRTAERQRQVTVLLLNAQILPEDPITIISGN